MSPVESQRPGKGESQGAEKRDFVRLLSTGLPLWSRFPHLLNTGTSMGSEDVNNIKRELRTVSSTQRTLSVFT